MTTQHEMQRLSALTWLQEQIAKEITEIKAAVAADVGVGGRAVARVGDEIVGSLSAPKPSQPRPRIVDEEAALSWLLEEFGTDGMVVMRPSEQGETTILEAAKRGPIPGVEVPEPRPGAPRFTLAAEADELVPAMIRAGHLSTADLLQIEGFL